MSPLLDAAHHLLDTTDDPHTRIARFYAALGEQPPQKPDPVRCALLVVHRLQLLLDGQDPPAIGTRDLSVLRALLALLFHSGINPLLARLTPPWLTNRPASLADLAALSTLLSDLVSTLFPRGVHTQPPQTLITTTILHRHVPDLLKAAIVLAWLPKPLCPQDDLSLHTLRPFVLRLLELCVYMRSVSPQIILNPLVKSPAVPDHDRSRCRVVKHAPTPAPCPQIMFILAHKESASSSRYPGPLCRSVW